MAEIISTLSLNGDKGTPTGTGQRYTSIATWEARQSNLIGTGDQEVLEVYADYTLSEALVFDWANTTTTERAIIRSAPGEGHGGDRLTGAQIQSGGSTVNALTMNGGFLTVQDMRAHHTSNAATNGRACQIAGGDLTVERCIFWRSVTTNGQNASNTRTNGAGASVSFTNCQFWGGSYGYYQTLASDATFENCTIDKFNATGIQNTAGTVSVTNTVAYSETGNSTGDMQLVSATGSNNATSDGTAFGASPQINIPNTAFTDYANEDYIPSSGGALDGTGANLSGSFTDDITGQTRTQWDIGAYGIISGGATFADTNAFTITIASGLVTTDPADIASTQTLENVDLDVAYVVTADAIASAQTIDNVDLTENQGISIGAITSTQALSNVDLVQDGQLSIDSLTMGQLLNNVNLSSAGQVAIVDIGQAQLIDNVTVTPAYSVDVNDLSVAQLLSNVTLSAEGSVAILDALQVQGIDNVELTSTGTIQVDSLTTQQLISIVRFGGLVVGSLDGEVVIFTALDGNPIIYH